MTVPILFAENSYFHDMVIEDASDDCFTLGAASYHNIVSWHAVQVEKISAIL